MVNLARVSSLRRFLARFVFAAAVGALVLFAIPAAQAQTKESAKSPAPTARLAPSYAIVATDRLRIDVYQEEDLSVIATVDSKGTVNLRLVGEVVVAGKTVPEAQKAIEAAYRDNRFLVTPQVTINIEEYAPREVSIDGWVRNPGRFPLPIDAGLTVADLVLKAGGLTDTARGSAVTVTRRGPDGKQTVFTIDVDSVIKGRSGAKASDNAFLLQPGDIVFVPQRII
jgi:polysaccharide export outer membrane protein